MSQSTEAQKATSELFRRKLRNFVKATMLTGNLSRGIATPVEHSEGYKRQVAELSRRFGHLVSEDFHTSATPIEVPQEVLTSTQIGTQNARHERMTEMRLQDWFKNDVNEQKKCIEGLVMWMLIYFFSSDETKRRIIGQLNEIEKATSDLTPTQETLLDSLAHCYHIRTFLSMFIATLNFNQKDHYAHEKTLVAQLPVSEGQNVGLATGGEPRFSHCRFREYMALVHRYPIFGVVDMVPTSPCFLCNDALPPRPIGSIMLSYPGVDEQDPYVAMPSTGGDASHGEMIDCGRVQRIVCPNCAVGLEAWWAVYHFLDVIVCKKLEVYVKQHPGSSLRDLHRGFLDEKRTELVNLFRSKTKMVYDQFSFYFRKQAPFEYVEGIFLKQDAMAKMLLVKEPASDKEALDKQLATAMRESLGTSILNGTKFAVTIGSASAADVLAKKHNTKRQSKPGRKRRHEDE